LLATLCPRPIVITPLQDILRAAGPDPIPVYPGTGGHRGIGVRERLRGVSKYGAKNVTDRDVQFDSYGVGELVLTDPNNGQFAPFATRPGNGCYLRNLAVPSKSRNFRFGSEPARSKGFS
jgi:hypothetical protein